MKDCEILKSQFRAAWIEWLYIDDAESRKNHETEIVNLQYKIFLNCENIDETFFEIQEELKKLPTPEWIMKLQN